MNGRWCDVANLNDGISAIDEKLIIPFRDQLKALIDEIIKLTNLRRNSVDWTLWTMIIDDKRT